MMKRLFGLFVLTIAGLGCASAASENNTPDNNAKAEPQNTGEVVTLDGLRSKVPAAWKAEKPGNKFRAFQFRVPKVEGDKDDAELVIFYFGPGSGGSVDDNIKRWKGFFVPPKGKSIDDVAKVEKFKVGKVEMTYLDVSGTFLYKNPPFDPNAKTERKENYRRFGVFFDSENGPYFITLTGPANTLERNKAGFDNWIKGFK